MNDTHDAMLDDVAVYALGSLPPADAQRVREHLETCPQCRAEYEALAPVTAAVARSAEACSSESEGAVVASPLLKARIMREVRATSAQPAAPVRRTPVVWPAYLAAAACFVLAIGLGISNLSLTRHLHQVELAQKSANEHPAVAAAVTDERALADLVNAGAKRYPVPGGEIVSSNNRLYIAMHDMPEPPKGKVYQAWTLPKGSKTMVPGQTFTPDKRGIAIVALRPGASTTHAVAVSIEPPGGSKAPTSSPVVLELLE
ncbi:MAG TPA: anti-sigma factor [Candidatus Aquilonibacter sp.]|nr:anti-sigma factor [Candidatus Aquilonibacter sp.]